MASREVVDDQGNTWSVSPWCRRLVRDEWEWRSSTGMAGSAFNPAAAPGAPPASPQSGNPRANRNCSSYWHTPREPKLGSDGHP